MWYNLSCVLCKQDFYHSLGQRYFFTAMNLFYTFTIFVLLRESSSKQNSNRGQAKFPRPFVSNFSDIRIGGLFPIHIRESNDSLCDLRVSKYSYILDHDRIPRCYRLNNNGVIWSETLRFSVEAIRPWFFNGKKLLPCLK